MTDTQERPPAAPPGGMSMDSYFKLTERGTSVGTEVRAGVTTFLVMAYIIFVNRAFSRRQASTQELLQPQQRWWPVCSRF